MAYTKQNFYDGQVLRAEHLNNMEAGIEEAGAIVGVLEADGRIGRTGTETMVSTMGEKVSFPMEVTSLVGMTATYEVGGSGWYYLSAPKVNKDEDYFISFNTTDSSEDNYWFFANNDNNGAMSKRAFGIGGNLTQVCPTFTTNYPDYDTIAYLYEETSDNLGLGMTLSKGWYAMNSDTFAVKPFRLEYNPIIIESFDELVTATVQGDLNFIRENWFALEKSRSFTITEKNVYSEDDGKVALFAADMSNWTAPEDTDTSEIIRLVRLLGLGEAWYGTDGFLECFSGGTGFVTGCEKLSLTWTGVTQTIDPKFLPEGGVGYSETKIGEIFPETTFRIEDGVVERFGTFGLKRGNNYTVNWNGTEYECECGYSEQDGVCGYFLGNLAVMGYGYDTGEPFLIGDITTYGASAIATSGDTGNYTLSIKGETETIHKIASEYLPAQHFDYAQNNYTAADYIKNRPCFNGEELIYLDEILTNGAAYVDVGSGLKMVKVADYIPPGEWVYNIKVNMIDGEFNGAGSEYSLSKTDYGWHMSNIDIQLLFGVTEEAVQNNIPVMGCEVPESGIYAINFFVSNVSLPINKPLDKSLLEISYDDLSDKPFGDLTNRRIVGYPYVESSSANKIHKREKDTTGVDICKFYKLSAKYISIRDIIGAELILSDGSTRIVTEADIIAKTEDDSFWEIENLLVSNASYSSFELTIGDYTYLDNGFTALGTYTCAYTGAYVTEIKLPDKTVEIDPKYLPQGGVGYTEGYDRLTVLEEVTKEAVKEAEDDPAIYIYGTLPISAGDELLIAWDGVEYKVVTEEIEGAEGAVHIGSEDSPFDGWYGIIQGSPCLALFTLNAGPHTLAIYKNTEVVHPIEPKYLTAAMPKVIDLNGYPAETYGTLALAMGSLFDDGGGTVSIADVGAFWTDVACSNALLFDSELPASGNSTFILRSANYSINFGKMPDGTKIPITLALQITTTNNMFNYYSIEYVFSNLGALQDGQGTKLDCYMRMLTLSETS